MRKVWTALVLVPVMLALLLAFTFVSCGGGYDCTQEGFLKLSSQEDLNNWMEACAEDPNE